MNHRNLEQRITTLEKRMQDLPARLARAESQILRLREGMHEDASAIRRLAAEGETEGRRVARVLFEEALARIRLLGESSDE